MISGTMTAVADMDQLEEIVARLPGAVPVDALSLSSG